MVNIGLLNWSRHQVKLDTGAAVSVVSDREAWLQSENLLTTKQTLRGPVVHFYLPVMGGDQGTITPSK